MDVATRGRTAIAGNGFLEDGKLTVFRRAGIYYARLRLAGSYKYTTRSLKTANEQTAVDLGRRLLFQLEQRADEGQPPKSKIAPSLMTTSGTVSGIIATVALRLVCCGRSFGSPSSGSGELAVETIDDKVCGSSFRGVGIIIQNSKSSQRTPSGTPPTRPFSGT